MVYRRNYRRRTLRKRRPMRRTRRMIRRPTTKSLRVHHFKRTFTLTPISTNNAGATFYGYSFTLSQLPNATEFTNLFDLYRINKILVRFVPNHNSSETAGTGSPQISNFHSVLDYNDASPATTLDQLYEYQNWKMSRGTSIHQRLWRPTTFDMVAVSGGSSSANPQWRQWLSTSVTNIPHFGLKVGIEQSAVNADTTWVPYVSVYLSCKSVK